MNASNLGNVWHVRSRVRHTEVSVLQNEAYILHQVVNLWNFTSQMLSDHKLYLSQHNLGKQDN